MSDIEAKIPPPAAGLALNGYDRPLPLRLERITGVMNAIGTVWIFAIMVLVNADIFGSTLFKSPVRGTTELTALSIVGIVFLQLPHTLWAGRVTRSDMFIGIVLTRWPSVGLILQGLFHLVGAGLLGLIFLASLPPFIEAVQIGDYVGAIGDFTAPTWPIKLLILLGSAMTALTFLMLAVVDILLLRARRRP